MQTVKLKVKLKPFDEEIMRIFVRVEKMNIYELYKMLKVKGKCGNYVKVFRHVKKLLAEGFLKAEWGKDKRKSLVLSATWGGLARFMRWADLGDLTDEELMRAFCKSLGLEYEG
jgi:hypothetical protein